MPPQSSRCTQGHARAPETRSNNGRVNPSSLLREKNCKRTREAPQNEPPRLQIDTYRHMARAATPDDRAPRSSPSKICGAICGNTRYTSETLMRHVPDRLAIARRRKIVSTRLGLETDGFRKNTDALQLQPIRQQPGERCSRFRVSARGMSLFPVSRLR